MNPSTLASIILFTVLAQAQEQWAPFPLYCFPRTAQAAADLQVAGYCPPPNVFYSYSQSYYTAACSCYDYQIMDGSIWSNCYTSTLDLGGFEATCVPQQPLPQAPATCNDGISTVCRAGSATSIVSDLCDVGSGLGTVAKGIFGGLRLALPLLARGALSVVDEGCKLWGKGPQQASSALGAGCNIWNQVGGCQA